MRRSRRAYNARMKTIKLPVIITDGEDGYIVARVPIIPGCISQGATVEEALANVKEAAELCLEGREEEGWELPAEYHIEQIEVGA
jgi:predicted RNase H-like HicB family nuclease